MLWTSRSKLCAHNRLSSGPLNQSHSNSHEVALATELNP